MRKTACGEAPRCWRNNLRRCRSPTPSLSQRPARLAGCSLCAINCSARDGGQASRGGRQERGGIGAAAKAGAKSRLLGGGGAGEKLHVLRARHLRGAAGPAVDPGGGDAGDEAPFQSFCRGSASRGRARPGRRSRARMRSANSCGGSSKSDPPRARRLRTWNFRRTSPSGNPRPWRACAIRRSWSGFF